MPRKNPLAEREKEICRRLRQFRTEQTKLSRVAFASYLGIDSSALANYEHGRVALRYGVVRRVAEEFSMNLRWLAEGKPPEMYFVHLDEEVVRKPDPKQLFSAAYDTFLKIRVEEAMRLRDVESLSCIPGIASEGSIMENIWWRAGGSPRAGLAAELAKLIEAYWHRMPEDVLAEFFSQMRDTAHRFFLDHKVEIESSIRARATRELSAHEAGPKTGVLKESLTSAVGSGKQAGVKTESPSSLQQLLNDVKSLTSVRNSKAALARAMRVTPQAVSEWLSGKSAPEAERVFRLLDWVRVEKERQQKSSGGVNAPPEPQTRKRSQQNEKHQQSGPPRK